LLKLWQAVEYSKIRRRSSFSYSVFCQRQVGTWSLSTI